MKINKVEDVVKEVLTNEKGTRSDNFLLVYEVYRRINKGITRLPFNNVMLLHAEHGLPSFETIVRCRRKLQANNENLRPSKKVQEMRLNKTADYINYSIDGYDHTFMRFVDSKE